MVKNEIAWTDAVKRKFGEGFVMKKDVTQRLAYYTRKVAERVSFHPAKKLPLKFTYRNERLIVYKRLLRDLIQSELKARRI
jgi:hypothetical protein